MADHFSEKGGSRAIDAGRLLDEGRWTTYQTLLIVATALTIILDGIDNQLLPNAIPTLIKEWGQARPAFTTALAIGPFGMMIGGLLGGLLGDRIGRRPALLGSVLAFGSFTAALALANSIDTLAVLRFLAGLGLGGAMPNAATLASEYVPQRHRPLAVTLTIVSIPLGGALAGELAAFLIPTQGWRTLFAICGAASVVIAGVLWVLLPESPRFLARHRDLWPDLARVLRRSGHDVPDGAAFAEAGVQRSSRASLASLFTAGVAMDTVAIWAAFFFGLMTNYVAVLLLPALLTGTDVGFSQPTASRALAMWNYGGVVAAVLGAMAVQRIGSRIAMLSMTMVAVVSGAILSVWPLDPSSATGLLVMILLAGAGVGGVQTTMYALAAHIYPTEIRSTGVGTAVAVGRIGNVLAAYAASIAIDRGGPTGYFLSWSLFMLLVFAALAVITRHVPRRS
ncbi:MAG TPA: MFS transporter [Vicinamibacterales bacterium]|jgi:AAHS family 4-hydroxybenzoate transporter-like MFS transporter